MAHEQPKRPVTVTREELYQLVWQTPMSRLAARYGISGNGLAKICDRLAIPYPPRGYWAKKAAGRKVVQYRLPDAKDDTPAAVTISPTMKEKPDPPVSQAVADELTAVRQKLAEISVPQRLSRPHPIIAKWLDERRRERDDPWRRGAVRNFTPIEHRQHRILDTLFKTLERHGYKVNTDDRHAVYFEIERERVDFQLREKLRQVRRPLTEEEKRSSYWRERGYVQELQPTGVLIFSLKTHLVDRAKHEWRDGETTLEAQLPDIIGLLLVAGPILKERRRQYEEEQRRRHEQERRRYEEEQQRKKDENQWRRFVDIAGHWRERELARQFLTALEAQGATRPVMIQGRSLADWIAWAHAHVEASDLLKIGAERIFTDVSSISAWTYND